MCVSEWEQCLYIYISVPKRVFCFAVLIGKLEHRTLTGSQIVLVPFLGVGLLKTT